VVGVVSVSDHVREKGARLLRAGDDDDGLALVLLDAYPGALIHWAASEERTPRILATRAHDRGARRPQRP
jgi:hypothetical protein